jgi:hypothetical protein
MVFVFSLLLANQVFTTQASASFSSHHCSNAAGTINYHFDMTWNNPGNTLTWTIQGREFSDDQVRKEMVKSGGDIESWPAPGEGPSMTGGRFYNEKVLLRFNVNGQEQTVTDWLLCRSAVGI